MIELDKFSDTTSKLASKSVAKFDKKVKRLSKELNYCREEIIEKLKTHQQFWYRTKNTNPNRVKDYLCKKHKFNINNVHFLDERCIIRIHAFKNGKVEYHLRYVDYGRKWVADKNDFTAYLQINY